MPHADKLFRTANYTRVCTEQVVYTRKNAQVDAILMKTGLNNVLLPTLFTLYVNNEFECFIRGSKHEKTV